LFFHSLVFLVVVVVVVVTVDVVAVVAAVDTVVAPAFLLANIISYYSLHFVIFSDFTTILL